MKQPTTWSLYPQGLMLTDLKILIDFFTSGKDGILRFDKEVSSPIVFEHGVRPLPSKKTLISSLL